MYSNTSKLSSCLIVRSERLPIGLTPRVKHVNFNPGDRELAEAAATGDLRRGKALVRYIALLGKTWTIQTRKEQTRRLASGYLPKTPVDARVGAAVISFQHVSERENPAIP
jgi:hypothetical protein